MMPMVVRMLWGSSSPRMSRISPRTIMGFAS
jgi:hypothetical protein